MPARASEDLPDPLSPTSNKKPQPRAAARPSRSSARVVSRSRPKKISSSAGPKASRPRNGEPFSPIGQAMVRAT